LLSSNIPFPQLLHTERSSDGIVLFVTAPIENLSAIATEMRQQSFQFEGISSVTTTCRGSIHPDLMEKVVGILEDINIKVMYMIVSAMSVTVFIRPNYRKQAIELLHKMVKKTNGM
jgi:aspartokinase